MNELYDIAEKNHISVDYFEMKQLKAFSLPKVIVINPKLIKTYREKRECVAHELGHHIKNAFYQIDSTLETRARQEERAKRWAVQKLIPASDLQIAIKNGFTEVWRLAEYFDVSDEFMAEAIRIHKLKGNI